MPCFSLTESKNSCHRSTFARAGLRSAITDIKDGGTTMHCWVPQSPNPSKRNLLLIHGLGVNAMWQFVDLLRHVTPHFNVYVPDLLFFGESFTTRPDRSESFQAECVMRVMEAHSVRRLSLLGLSYGGFVGYSLAAKYKEAVERVVICCAAVCLEEKDIREGVFPISDLDEAASILVPQTPQKLRELIKYTFFKPPPLGLIPSCLLMDFIEPTLILWGEHDQVFPLEFAYKLKRHLGENAELVVIKDAGHAINVQKPKEYYNHIKSFLLDMQQPSANKHQQHSKPLQSLT
ncbi:unnamed protein product [Prunus armeniaca]|uniref:Uncharacterized protein LOC103319652 isoform X2 n=1 Tax=Prunus mume TaxID=102107 RepID=A0ABM0N4J3_PRUMU|nr:PREDICTED: uncharacterized protein LOC103319652 isoform X2 [Prunus mume]